jgi:hypothetical protein
VVRADGSIEPPVERPATRVISEKAAREMTLIMQGVTEVGGTARAAAIDGYAVAGKTGTAQKVSGGHYDASKWVSSFIGFAPAENPRVAIVVMVDEPQGGHLGGAVAAPVFKEIAEQALRYLHVPPSPALLARMQAASQKAGGKNVTGRAGATAEANGDGGDVDERIGSDVPVVAIEDDADVTTGGGDGFSGNNHSWETVAGTDGVDMVGGARVAGDESDSQRVSGGDAVGEIREQMKVPDFSGLTVAAVLRAAHRSGVELALDGAAVSGVALRQDPSAGTAAHGVVCRVVFGRPD